jgi:hypothetical protein
LNLVNPYLFDTSGGGGGGYTASGAGTSGYNGTYVPDGSNSGSGGRLRYKLDSTHYILWSNNYWYFWADPNAQGAPTYFIASTAMTPPLTGWSWVMGSPPAPTLTAI